MQAAQLHRGKWQQHGRKGSPGAPSSSLELRLAILLGPSNDTQLWLPKQTFSNPGAAPGMGPPLHWCLLVSQLALSWVGEIRLLHPQHQHRDEDRHHPGVLEQDTHPSSQHAIRVAWSINCPLAGHWGEPRR